MAKKARKKAAKNASRNKPKYVCCDCGTEVVVDCCGIGFRRLICCDKVMRKKKK